MRIFRIFLIAPMFTLLFSGAFADENEIHSAAAGFIPILNQKVAGYFLVQGVPSDFKVDDYRKALEETCHLSPVLQKQVALIFDHYEVFPRKVGEGFSVMYCDREKKTKIMEDFSCNVTCVEVKSYKISNSVTCQFEKDWQSIVEKKCVRGAPCDE